MQPPLVTLSPASGFVRLPLYVRAKSKCFLPPLEFEQTSHPGSKSANLRGLNHESIELFQSFSWFSCRFKRIHGNSCIDNRRLESKGPSSLSWREEEMQRCAKCNNDVVDSGKGGMKLQVNWFSSMISLLLGATFQGPGAFACNKRRISDKSPLHLRSCEFVPFTVSQLFQPILDHQQGKVATNASFLQKSYDSNTTKGVNKAVLDKSSKESWLPAKHGMAFLHHAKCVDVAAADGMPRPNKNWRLLCLLALAALLCLDVKWIPFSMCRTITTWPKLWNVWNKKP